MIPMDVQKRAATSSPVKPPSKPNTQSASEPIKLFILPENRLEDARVLLLQHPRDGCRRRFYFCPQNGLYEFTKISAQALDPRSILFAPADDEQENVFNTDVSEQPVMIDNHNGYVNKAAEFFVATPFDPAFLLLPILMQQENKKNLFQPLDDLLEYHLEGDQHLRYAFKHGRQSFENAMERICDQVNAGEENLYRISEEKLLKELLSKCERVVDKGLPVSLEDKFVSRALEAPVQSIKREESNSTTTATKPGDSIDTKMYSIDTQSSTTSTVFSETASITTVGIEVDDDATIEIRRLQRIRTIFTFITSSYTPKHVSRALMSLMDSNKSSLDFAPLNNHLAHLAKLRAEAVALRSLGDFSHKRNLEEEEFNETREEKKRKLAEEEKRKKAGESMGVRALKKVDVSGMKKMSAFFTKAVPKAKA